VGEGIVSGPAEMSLLLLVLPVLGEIVEQNAVAASDEPIVITPQQYAVLRAYYEPNLAQFVVAQEFIEWAIANAPVAMVHNLARVGLVE
jgi:hypothetical protein